MNKESDEILKKFFKIFKKKYKSHHNPFFDKTEKKKLN